MASGTVAVRKIDYRFEHFVFSGIAFLILVLAFVRFSRSYYLAGIFKAPLPDLLVQIHGAVFTLWMLLLITQTSLVAGDRVDISSLTSRLWTRLWIAGLFGGIGGPLNGESLGRLSDPVAVDAVRRVVHKKDSTCNVVGRRFPCDHGASGQASRLALRAFSGFCRLEADARTFIPVKVESKDEALLGEKTELLRIGRS